MSEARVRQREYGIKDKTIENSKKIITIKKHVRQIVEKEIKFVSLLFPHNIKEHYNPQLAYSQNLLSFINPYDKKSPIHSNNFRKRLTNLLAGIEILAIGTSFHSFSADNFIKKYRNKEDTEKYERRYTPNLLFGDILYSRSIIYLLKYGDYIIFNGILDSLKTIHKNRLLLHQKLVNTLKKKKEFISEIIKDTTLISGISSLTKDSFMVGWGTFYDYGSEGYLRMPYEIINEITLFKTFKDLEVFFRKISKLYPDIVNINHMVDRRNFIKSKVDNRVSKLKPEWLKNNFKSLIGIYI